MRILWNPAPSADSDIYQLLKLEYDFRTRLTRHLLQLEKDINSDEETAEFGFLFNPETRKFIPDSDHPYWTECIAALSGIEELKEFF